jgi:iron complex outermembrane receptor protein
MKKITFVFLMLFALIANAQETFRVSGTLFDENKNPLPGATVKFMTTENKNLYSITTIDGVYAINLKSGDYIIKIQYIGYETLTKNITLGKSLKDVNFSLIPSQELLDEVLVSAVRVNSESPVTHSNLSKEDIAKRNLGQDIPILMNYMPNVVTTSDAGAGIGYTGIRVRGSDATRVNVTINGIPYNDSESMGTFWVNMGDFSSSIENLQLQRGVGTSTNGAGAFGASLNLLTDAVAEKASVEIGTSTGSFNTFKSNVKFTTGRINDHLEFSGRLSTINSDGYIDRASSDLKSYFLQGSYIDENTLIKALAFGGVQETYQAWYGITAADLENDRTKNYYTYDNEVDHYNQDHYQLHWNQKYNDHWSSNIAVHYTYGRGYFEQFKEEEGFADYGFTEINIGGETINTTDIIRRRWLDNDFYGTTFSFLYNNNEDFNLTIGGALNKYEGDHFGEVIWAEYASNSSIRDRYYEDYGIKTDFNIFTKANYTLNEKFNLYGDLQIRTVNYKANGVSSEFVDDSFEFFNPKAGITYLMNNSNNLYLSYARANREPNRTDYENGNPKPETLDDFELGWRLKKESFKINSNLYFMKYKDQLVLTGELDDVGAAIRANAGDSYRLGIEIDAVFKLTEKFNIQPNIAMSINKLVDYVATSEVDGSIINYGDTDIPFSPNIVIGNMINYNPLENLNLTLLSKYVGEQFMSNIEYEKSKLESYFINDLNIVYRITPNKIVKSIDLNLLVNNIFNVAYVSNGADYGNDYIYYFPQATRNFLVGATFKF